MSDIRFHESGRTFIWRIASREVHTLNGGVVAHDCYNLRQGRQKAADYIKGMESRERGWSLNAHSQVPK
jgi:hypothetical protein